MCKRNEHLTIAADAEFDSRRRVGRPNGSRQAIPALPDPMTGIFPDLTCSGKIRFAPPINR